MLLRFLSRLLGRFRRRDLEREVDAELAFHLEMQIETNLARGMAADEARRAALLALGGVDQVKESVRDQRWVWLDSAWQDVRQAVRRLCSRPGRSAAAVAILVLAPAVGMSAAVMHLVFGLMFNTPPHVAEPERVIQVRGPVSLDEVIALRSSTKTAELGAYSTGTMDYGTTGDLESVTVQCGTWNYLALLGAQPLIGRMIGREDQGVPDVAVLGHGFWRRRFAARYDVLGTRVTLRRQSYTVVGVAPAEFTGLGGEPVDVWIPWVEGGDGCSGFGSSVPSSPVTIGRLHPGFTVEQASRELAAFKTSSLTHRAPNGSATSLVSSSRSILRRDRRVLVWLAGGALTVLFIACSNAAALLSIQALRRRREIAIRCCLGAPRARILGLLAAESVAAASLCALTAWLAAALTQSFLHTFYSSYISRPGIDVRLWLFVGVLSLLGCVMSGALPALRASRWDFRTLLQGDALATERHGRLRSLILVGELAVTFALLVGAGLFWRSVANLRQGAGYDMDHAFVVTIDPRFSVSDEDSDIQPWRDELLRHLQRHPTVNRAARAMSVPLGGGIRGFVLVGSVPGRRTVDRPAHSSINLICPEYFRTLDVPLLRGRSFSPADTADSAPVTVVSEKLALDLWGTTDVVGRCAFIKGLPDCTRVAGVVRSMNARVIWDALPEVFIPLAQAGLYDLPWLGRVILVRANHLSKAMAAASVLARTAAPGMAVEIEPLSAGADLQTRSWRLGATAFGLVGVLTFLLAVMAVYCALSLMVRQRTQEIGVRVALGASPLRIFSMALRQGVVLLVAGLVIGTGLAFGVLRLVRGMLFGVTTIDMGTFVWASGALLVVGAFACAVPSIRAARQDPLDALRIG